MSNSIIYKRSNGGGGSGTITTYGKLLFGVPTVIRFISYLTAILNYIFEDDSVYNKHCMLYRYATTFNVQF